MTKNIPEGYIQLSLPKDNSKRKQLDKPTREKTSLFIPTAIRDTLPFHSAKHVPNVFISYDMTAVLRAISFYGQFGRRFDTRKEKGLEHDVTKQQPIVYTIVVCEDHILLYRRADKNDVPKSKLNLLGDQRMQGKISIGFGGHTTGEDKGHLTTLGMLFPGIHPEIQTIAALDQAISADWQEELGIGQSDIEEFHVLGAFYEKFDTTVLAREKDIPVEAFHLGICAVAKLDSERLRGRGLYLPKNEIHDALWVPVKNLKKILQNFEKRGAKIDRWTTHIVAEFLPLIINRKKRTIKKSLREQQEVDSSLV